MTTSNDLSSGNAYTDENGNTVTYLAVSYTHLIHVYNSLGIHFAVMHSSYFKDKKHVQHASLVLCVLIVLSTMFIKQHSVFDVSTAFMLAFVMYNVVYIKNWMHLPQKSGSFQDAANSKVRI